MSRPIGIPNKKIGILKKANITVIKTYTRNNADRASVTQDIMPEICSIWNEPLYNQITVNVTPDNSKKINTGIRTALL
jgi:hypothetical protein